MVHRIMWVLFIVFVVGCASSKEGGSNTITGMVYVVGNEPFTSVALQDSSGKVHRLSVSRELEQQLRALQGKKVEIRFSGRTSTAEGEAIVVTECRELNIDGPKR